MGKIEVTLKWLLDKPISPEELSVFLENKGHNGGIYFKIHNNKRIAYIGEAGKGKSNFRNRFTDHLNLALYGQYSAVDCGDGDLFEFYDCHVKYGKNCCPKISACQKNGLNPCVYYKPSKYKNFIELYTNLEKIREDIYRGIRINHNYMKRLTYVFVVISKINGKEVDEMIKIKIQKEIESIFILQKLQCVLNKKDEIRNVKDFYVNRGFLWGHIDADPEGDYVIKNEGICPDIAKIMKDELGLTESPWYFPTEDIKRLKDQIK